MNLAHLHLLLNHFPIIGTIVAFGLFITSFVGKNDDLKRQFDHFRSDRSDYAAGIF